MRNYTMRQTRTIDEQEKLFFDSLEGKDKRDYYMAYFVSELVFALKSIRVEKKLTQKDVASKMGLKQAYVSKIENMEKMPTIETIAKYLFALNYDLEDSKQLIEDMIKTLLQEKEKEKTLPRLVACFIQSKSSGHFDKDYKQPSGTFKCYVRG